MSVRKRYKKGRACDGMLTEKKKTITVERGSREKRGGRNRDAYD